VKASPGIFQEFKKGLPEYFRNVEKIVLALNNINNIAIIWWFCTLPAKSVNVLIVFFFNPISVLTVFVIFAKRKTLC